MLDLRMPKKDGLQVLTELMSRRVPEPRIIVMTAYESDEDLRRALNAGAKGYLVKGANPQQIKGGNSDGCRGTILASSGDR
jgi:two-component system, NarL family, response regulator